MKLYFGNAVTTATTLMILALLGFIGYSIFHRVNIQYWGRRSVILLVFGLVICCFASARDHTAHHRWQLRTGTVPPHQHSYHRGLHWRISDYRCRHCHAHCKDAAGTPGLVLCHVRRCDAENRDHGDRTDHPLRRKEHVLMPLVDPSRWTGAASAASHSHAAVQEIM